MEKKGEMSKVGMPKFITPVMIADANAVIAWLQDYICQPHPQLGRKGAVCPFVQTALQRDKLYMTFHYEVEGSSVEAIEALLHSYIDVFLNYPPTDEPQRINKALLILFPCIPSDRTTILDVVHTHVKTDFVRSGLMLGQFHPTCSVPAAWNPAFPVSRSPLPLVAVRHMAQHDILFLNQDALWFAEYRSRFGWQYEQGRVSIAEYVKLYQEAKERFHSQPHSSNG